jgi:hypothetical protein
MSVDLIEWNRNGLCGAACAHMVMHARQLTGTTRDEQELIWTTIKAHTNGKPIGKRCSGIVPERFRKMVREACENEQRVMCWCSYPDALKATLEGFLGSGVNITLSQSDDEDIANDVIKGCLNRGGLPIVLINSGKHWVVVDGWVANAPEPVRVLDPALGTPSTHTVEDWNIFFMSAVDCGAYDNKYVVLEVDP